MPSKIRPQSTHPIQALSSHFVLASDGQRMPRGSRLLPPRGAKCQVAGFVTPRLTVRAPDGVQRRAEFHGLYEAMGTARKAWVLIDSRRPAQYVKRAAKPAG